ncbi:hypothetical protein [Fodinicola feengrottensis]|uniref:hypothetical protein n=1 Tax=Fodinicola feengrottensis TaxID=435914 RepID=UPI002440F230|nr:hypothetical protein [Fodinicola feengrottensis]
MIIKSGIAINTTGKTWLTRIHMVAIGPNTLRNRPSAYAAGNATTMVSSMLPIATTVLFQAAPGKPCWVKAST